jgi:hypothetical protein
MLKTANWVHILFGISYMQFVALMNLHQYYLIFPTSECLNAEQLKL